MIMRRPRRAEIEQLVAVMLDEAMDVAGIVGADAIYHVGRSYSVSLRDGEPEENTCGDGMGISLRVMASDGRQGVAYSNGISRAHISELIEWSTSNCRASEPEEDIMLFRGEIDSDESALELYDASIDEGISQQHRIKTCVEMTKIARAADPRVVSVRSAYWADGVSESFYASSEGASAWSLTTSSSCGASVVVSDGESNEMGSFGRRKRHVSDLDPELYAREAALRTARLVGARPMPTGVRSVIFDPESAASIVDAIGGLFCASDIHKGRSMMKGRLGEEVASAAVTIVDDARVPRMYGSSSFDAEGSPTQRTTLIERGTAKNFLYDLKYAAKDGTVSTGSASRGSLSLVDVGTSNLFFEPGSVSREKLIASVSDGLYVTEMMGLHTMDPVSGEFSLGAKGYRVAGGKLCEPVSGVTIAGDLIGLLKKITAAADDLERFSATAAPTILAEEITIAGD